MKCAACNHEHDSSHKTQDDCWDSGCAIGSERFTRIQSGPLLIEVEGSRYSEPESERVKLFACPKCGTVRMESC